MRNNPRINTIEVPGLSNKKISVKQTNTDALSLGRNPITSPTSLKAPIQGGRNKLSNDLKHLPRKDTEELNSNNQQ